MNGVQQKDNVLVTLLLLFCQWPIVLPVLGLLSFWLFRNRVGDNKQAQRFFKNFRMGGHRGSPSMQPENTIPSMEQAKAEGADLIEFDVSLTKDNVAVILHDDTLERTTNMDGQIRDYFYKQLLECDCAAKFMRMDGQSYERKFIAMPTLDELVKWAKANEIKMLFDVKDSDISLITQLSELFEEHQLYDTGIVSSFFPTVAYRIKHFNPRILTGLTWRRWFLSYTDLEAVVPRHSNIILHLITLMLDIVYIWCVKSWLPAFLGVEMVLTSRYEISEAYVKQQRDAGRTVCAWTVNDENEMLWMNKTLKIPFLTDKPFLAKPIGIGKEVAL